jgi:hypothetical protein
VAKRFNSFGLRGTVALALFLAGAVVLKAQYPGQLAKSEKSTPTLRAVSVLEWTGEPGHPKTSRLVPITVFDGEKLQDGGLYLARPEPLAVAPGVEYELMENGKTTGLYDVLSAGQEQGGWVGYGNWKKAPVPPTLKKKIEKIEDWNDADDRPVLHRKHPPEDEKKTDAKPDSPDADRPTLRKNSDESATPDPDRPTLRKPRTSGDPQQKKKKEKDVGYVEALPTADAPDRPRLKRGKPADAAVQVLPSLMGMPLDLRQTVAVSDAEASREHLWRYEWTDAGEEARMRGLLEAKARTVLGLNTPLASTQTAPKTAAKHRTKNGAKLTKPAKQKALEEPASLADEQFRVFELAYGAGATLVLSARTEPEGNGAPVKFVTLIAQPDLYGNLVVLLVSVTDAAHLDLTPRMRLVGAVDAEADHRGELVFELRGASERQFALYRVGRGQAERLFVTAPTEMR